MTPPELWLAVGLAFVAGAYIGAIVVCMVVVGRQPAAADGEVLVRCSRELLDGLLAESDELVALDVGADELDDGTYELTFRRVDAIILR